MPSKYQADRLVLDILTYCKLTGVKPSVFNDHFVRADNERGVFYPFTINEVNRNIGRNLYSSLDSFRRDPTGSRSKFIPLKQGWTIEGKVRLKKGSTVFLPTFTEENYQSQFYSTPNTNEPVKQEISIEASATSEYRKMPNSWSKPDRIVMDTNIDGQNVDYLLETSLNNKEGRVLLGQPWNIVIAYMSKNFIKGGKSMDGLFIFHKAQNSLDLTRNAVDVATVDLTKKGVFLVQVEGLEPGVFDQIMSEIRGESETFGADTYTISNSLAALKQKVIAANKAAKSVIYYVHFKDFPYNLVPGSFQMEATTDINERGLTSRLVEHIDVEGEDDIFVNGFFVVVGIEDKEGEDNLTEEVETEDPRVKARRLAAEKRRKSRTRRNTSVSAADVDSLADGVSNISFASPTVQADSVPRVMSPSTRTMELFYSKLHQQFKSTDAVPAGDASFMRAVALSCGESEEILPEWYKQAMLEMYHHCNWYCNEFELEAGDFSTEKGYYAQIQALASTLRVIIHLYEVDEFDSSRMKSLPYTEYAPRQGEDTAKGYVFILDDGKTHHALYPLKVADPESEDDDDSNPPVNEVEIATEAKQPSSVEKVKNFFGFGTSLKQGTPSTEPRKLDTVFNDEAMSTAQTVQRSGSSKQKPPPVEKKKKSKKKPAPTVSPRVTRSRKAKGGTPRN
eukprot:scaffold4690_cov124-Skeletonema_menzelii.AAC.2